MAIGELDIAARAAPVPDTAREALDRERALGPLFVAPALFLIVVLVAYPFVMAG